MMGDFLWRREKEEKKRIFIYDPIDLAFLRSRFGMRLLVEYTVWFFTVCTVTLVYQTSHTTGKRGYRLSRVRIRNLSVPFAFLLEPHGCSINGVFPTRNRFFVSKWCHVTVFFSILFFFSNFERFDLEFASWLVEIVPNFKTIQPSAEPSIFCSFIHLNSFILWISINTSLILSSYYERSLIKSNWYFWKIIHPIVESLYVRCPRRRWLRSKHKN